MQNNTVRQKLISLNSGKSNIAYAGNNMWFTENPNYADLVAELKESIQNNEVRGSILIATDSGIMIDEKDSLGCPFHISYIYHIPTGFR